MTVLNGSVLKSSTNVIVAQILSTQEKPMIRDYLGIIAINIVRENMVS